MLQTDPLWAAEPWDTARIRRSARKSSPARSPRGGRAWQRSLASEQAGAPWAEPSRLGLSGVGLPPPAPEHPRSPHRPQAVCAPANLAAPLFPQGRAELLWGDQQLGPFCRFRRKDPAANSWGKCWDSQPPSSPRQNSLKRPTSIPPQQACLTAPGFHSPQPPPPSERGFSAKLLHVGRFGYRNQKTSSPAGWDTSQKPAAQTGSDHPLTQRNPFGLFPADAGGAECRPDGRLTCPLPNWFRLEKEGSITNLISSLLSNILSLKTD